MSPSLDRSIVPMSSDLRPFSFPPISHHRLSNGIEVLLLERPQVGIATVEVVAPGGGTRAPLERPGLAAFTAGTIDEGTTRSTATELARRIESLGGELSSGCDWNASSISVSLLTQNLEPSLEIFSEVVLDAAFAEDTVQRLRKERIAEIERRRQDPDSLAALALCAGIYGEGMYGTPLLGTLASLEEIQRGELVDFFRQTVHSRGVTLVAAGDFDREALLRGLDDGIGALGLAEPPEDRAPQRQMPSENRVHLVDRPESAQTELRIGHAGAPRRAPGRAARLLLNSILGGKFTSRLNLNLREKHGYTYGVSSRFTDRRGAGPFFVSTAVANEVAGDATREILAELKRLTDEPVTAQELADAKSYLLGVFPYTLQTVQGLAGRLEELATFELPDDTFDRVRAEMAEVTPSEILAAAREWISPDALHIVAVGPAETLEESLGSLGTVQRHDPDRIAGATH